jgi:hypothetical protein
MSLSQYWFSLGKDLEKSGDYVRAIIAFYNAGADDELRALVDNPQLVRKTMNSKSKTDLENLIDGLFVRWEAINDDGCDEKTLDAIRVLIKTANDSLDERYGMKGVAG